MLVLTRKVGETVCIGDSIKITIVDIERGMVKVGVGAPKDVVVLRSELIGRKGEGEKQCQK